MTLAGTQVGGEELSAGIFGGDLTVEPRAFAWGQVSTSDIF
jgi:hypothetical protein